MGHGRGSVHCTLYTHTHTVYSHTHCILTHTVYSHTLYTVYSNTLYTVHSHTPIHTHLTEKNAIQMQVVTENSTEMFGEVVALYGVWCAKIP